MSIPWAKSICADRIPCGIRNTTRDESSDGERFENVAYFKVPNARLSVESCVLAGIPAVPRATHAEYTACVKAQILYDRENVRII